MDILNILLEITIYSGVIFAATMLLKRCFKKKMSPLLHYAVWLLLVMRLMIPVTLESSVHLFVHPAETQNQPAAEQVQPQVSQPVAAPETNTANAWSTQPQVPGANANQPGQAATAPLPAPAAELPVTLPASAIILIVWLSGMGLGILYLIILYGVLRRKIRKKAAPPSKRLSALFEEVKHELGIRTDVKLICQYEYGTPALMFPRTILMPIDALVAMDDEQAEFALRHELVHFKRGDQIIRILLSILNAVHWFNPFVWIAFRQIRADMETACDGAVVGRLNDAQRSRYASLIVGLFAQPKHRQLVLGMAQGNTKKTAEQRIRGIFMANRSRHSAKLVCAGLAAVLLISCFTTACQPTPETPVVVGKDGDKLEEIIHATPASQDTRTQTPASAHYTDTFAGADDTVTIRMDADVIVPDGDIPVVEVKPYAIGIEQVRAMAKVLFRGNTAYEPKIGMTRAELETKIKDLRKSIDDEAGMLEDYSGNQAAVDKLKAEYETRITKYEELYATAPDTIARRATDWTFHLESYYMDRVEIGVGLDGNEDQTTQLNEQYYDSDTIQLVATVEDYHAMIQVMNEETNGTILHLVAFGLGSNVNGEFAYWNPADSRPMDMTRAEAITMVQDALSQMGITDMRLDTCTAQGSYKKATVTVDPDNEQAALAAAAGEGGTGEATAEAPAEGEEVFGYAMNFVSTYQGVASHNMMGFDPDSAADQYAAVYPYEQLSVQVGNGIITYFDWYSPTEPVAVENKNVAVLTLEEAVAAFKKQSQLEYTLARLSQSAPEYVNDEQEDSSSLAAGEINITDVRLDLMRMSIKDRPGAYRMVPVWTFTGDEPLLYIKDEQTQALIPAPRKPHRKTSCTYAVINAIDGSVINGNLGY